MGDTPFVILGIDIIRPSAKSCSNGKTTPNKLTVPRLWLPCSTVNYMGSGIQQDLLMLLEFFIYIKAGKIIRCRTMK
jgi:hypothetical protein